MVYHKIREDLEEKGVIFQDTDTRSGASGAVPGVFRDGDPGRGQEVRCAEYGGLVGRVVYLRAPRARGSISRCRPTSGSIPRTWSSPQPTLIIVDEDAYVHYVEGCTAPVYSSDSLHSAVVEIIVKKGARCRYTTIQNWSNNVYNLVTKRAVAQAARDDGVGRRQHRVQGHDEVPGCLPDGRALPRVGRCRSRSPARAIPGRRRLDGALRAEHVLEHRVQVGGQGGAAGPPTGGWSRSRKAPRIPGPRSNAMRCWSTP